MEVLDKNGNEITENVLVIGGYDQGTVTAIEWDADARLAEVTVAFGNEPGVETYGTMRVGPRADERFECSELEVV